MSTQSEAVKRWRNKARTLIRECMGGGCQICNYNKSYNALELHHVNPEEKELSIGFILSSCRSWSVLFDELEKCILLCANCHREVHEGLTDIPLNYQRFDRPSAITNYNIKSAYLRKANSEDVIREKIRNQKTKTRLKSQSKLVKKTQQGKISSRCTLIRNSGVDFTKYGWVKKISELLGISQQKVVPWMKRHMLDFYNEVCYKRS